MQAPQDEAAAAGPQRKVMFHIMEYNRIEHPAMPADQAGPETRDPREMAMIECLQQDNLFGLSRQSVHFENIINLVGDGNAMKRGHFGDFFSVGSHLFLRQRVEEAAAARTRRELHRFGTD